MKKTRKVTVGRICRKRKVQAWNERVTGDGILKNNRHKCQQAFFLPMSSVLGELDKQKGVAAYFAPKM